jgi:histidyl-tRNA synthetase
MYTFKDKGDRSMTLRPEGTAPVIRALIENQLHQTTSIQKLFYIGPMFRYERAQAGRYRQHHQFGAEAIGNGSAEQDAELIDLICTFYQRLGLKNLTIYLNSLGNETARLSFRQALKDYLQPHLHLLSPDSQNRFEINPLRILDSKDARDQAIIAKAPSVLDFLDEESRDHFMELQKLLHLLKINYKINPLLVRGLDYYNKTVFEIVAGELGSQNSVGGGGRYDGLIQSMGGPDLPSIGFGTGLERVIQVLINQGAALPQTPHITVFLIPLGKEAKEQTFTILHDLRQTGIAAQMEFNERKVGKSLQYADQIKAKYVIVLGEHELAQQEIELKEMATGRSTKIPLADLSNHLKLLHS